MWRTYPLLYNCPRKQRPRGESGPFSPVSKNLKYRSCFQRLSPTHSRMEQHLKHRNKHLRWELLECPAFGTRHKLTQFHRRTHSLWKQPREKFRCEWVSPSWTRCIKTKRFVFCFSYPMNAPNHGIFFSNLGAHSILSCSSPSARPLSAPKKHLKAVIPHRMMKILWLIIHSTHFFHH